MCRCTDQPNSQLLGVLGLLGKCFPQNYPFPSGDRHFHVTHCSSGQAHSLSQTASRSVQPFLYGSQMLYNALSMGKKTPKIAPSSCDFVTLPEDDRSTAINSCFHRLLIIIVIQYFNHGHHKTIYFYITSDKIN